MIARLKPPIPDEKLARSQKFLDLENELETGELSPAKYEAALDHLFSADTPLNGRAPS
jgi:hypothetical protein